MTGRNHYNVKYRQKGGEDDGIDRTIIQQNEQVGSDTTKIKGAIKKMIARITENDKNIYNRLCRLYKRRKMGDSSRLPVLFSEQLRQSIQLEAQQDIKA